MKKIHLFFLFWLISQVGLAQNIEVAKRLTLEQVITLALRESIWAKQAAANKENNYWQFRTYKAGYKPQLALDGTLPDFSRTISPVIQPDGTTAFRQVAINNSALNLSLSQGIGLTGGELFVRSQVQRFDDFDRNQKSYNSNPAIIGISQPLFGYNALAWNKKIEPLRYEESLKKYVEDREVISLTATERFFDLLLQQVNAEIAQKNLENNEAIYKIAEEKFRLGKVSRNDLLQLQLSLMNAKVAQAQASLDARNASLKLRTYIGYTGDELLELENPANVPALIIDEELALAEARKNRKEAISFKRKILQAEQEVAYAKGKNGLNANLFATYGLTNQADSFTDSYLRPIDQQRVRIGFDIPIMDWGKQRATIKTAEINQQLAQYTVEQDVATFEQAVTTQVNQFQMLRERLNLSAQADQIAQERYEITKATYLIGKISITDLNIAALEKDQAKRAYVSSLRDFWTAYYNLRTLTLYDFENNKPINLD
ncbi:TolC family protein [Adhaeribacter rhizoryzae]|uniref:TolC family protein n=1 Tax=Adhaeribacter rhizoryzae TaxID=2607907 RepID=A0A5M6DFA7_9BACT|nr:TolC family protein [Adhaeribacter rhizoryzae]KAA5544952.1 TolC family protein [Adhaeribacter rhizoryzae]